MVIHTSADLGPGEHPYACFSAESRPLTSAYIARVRVDRPMDTIEARRVKHTPGNLQVMRRAEEGTANQCPITKESTGAPVSVTEQDSHSSLHSSVINETVLGKYMQLVISGIADDISGIPRTCTDDICGL